jgi:hypothetical protein
MIRPRTVLLLLLALALGLLVLAGCGGGGDGGDGGDQTEAAPPPPEEEEETTTEEEAIEVPDVVGESEEDAEEELEDEGFEVEATTTTSEEEPGTVVSQDPEGGEDAEEGDEVAIEVSGGIDPNAALLQLVPGRIRATCDPPDDPNAFPEAAVAKLVCRPPGRQAHSVQYNLFETRNEMQQAYNASLDQVREDVGQNFRGGDCETDTFAEHGYTSGSGGGRVMCYILEGRAWIEWSHNELFVYSFGFRNDNNDVQLYRWWSGPGSGPQPPS